MREANNNSKKIAEHIVSMMLRNDFTKSQDTFEKWLKENPTAIDILNELSDEELLNGELDDFYAIDKQKSVKIMLHKLSKRRRKKLFVRVTSVAAALIVVSFLALNYLAEEVVVENKIAATEIKSVRLIINDSEEVELNKDTITSNVFGAYRTGVKEITYTSSEERKITKNRLIVPSKESFTIRLSDGTKVTLNANSELVFPSEFVDGKREVEIKGEAFFEVAKDQERPFIVHCDSILVQVYGTSFNVNNRKQFSTFLCEGSVGVRINNQPQQMLSPNQHITIENGCSRIETVTNGEKYIDWTTGHFIFDSDNLEFVIKKLSEWYDMDLIIDSGKKDALITGSFERTLKLENIIESIEIVSSVKLIKR